MRSSAGQRDGGDFQRVFGNFRLATCYGRPNGRVRPETDLRHPPKQNMTTKTQELLVTLEKLASLLSSDGERNWSAWMLRAKSQLENSDYSGVEYLLSAYGGMGSFNDFVAGQST